MDPKLTFRYDRQADILHIDKRATYSEQDIEELGDDVVARLNPTTNAIENLEVLFFSTRLLRSDLFELPVDADLRLANCEQFQLGHLAPLYLDGLSPARAPAHPSGPFPACLYH